MTVCLAILSVTREKEWKKKIMSMRQVANGIKQVLTPSEVE